MSTDMLTLTEQAAILRQELKLWESAFAATHDGRKASREEIKQEPALAAKYKEYTKLRDILSGKTPASALAKSPSRKRKAAPEEVHNTPTKRRVSEVRTPRRISKFVEDLPKENQTPRSGKEMDSRNNTPKRAFVGPTPQKDGLVLGLFDSMLSEDESTPSKSQFMGARIVLGSITANATADGAIATTPCKSNGRMQVTETPTTTRHARTPQSSTRRIALNSIVTPSKRKWLSTADGQDDNALIVPPSSSKGLRFSTPAFLRRESSRLDTIIESQDLDGQGSLLTSPSAPRRWQRPGLGHKMKSKFLSSLIAENRVAEDERLDEEMDMLREIEDNESKSMITNGNDVPKHEVQVEDSQQLDLLGPDGARKADLSDSEPGSEGEEQRRRRWKKKGQKRQTRRTNMKPVQRPRRDITLEDHEDQADGGDSDAEENPIQNSESTTIVNETQLQDQEELSASEAESEHSNDLDDAYYCENSTNDMASQLSQKRQKTADTKNITISSTTTVTGHKEVPNIPKEDGPIKKAARKVSATAHANFRRLKIRSSMGAAGARQGGGRFGRRRR